MYATDFEFDGKKLSEFGMIICDFDDTSDPEIISSGSVITFNRNSLNYGKSYSLTSTSYDECINTEFDICKNPDTHCADEMEISFVEYRSIMRWLNRRGFFKFRILHEDDSTREPCFFNASFNISKINISGKLVGIRLKMETNGPFGYGAERKESLVFSDDNLTNVFVDTSDEIGNICPNMKITFSADGDFLVKNSFNGSAMQIKTCSTGETITVYGEIQQIESSLDGHDIANDFNYEFLKIGNNYQNRENEISVNIPCSIEISYFPIIKDTL